jgi:hypothetical protein
MLMKTFHSRIGLTVVALGLAGCGLRQEADVYPIDLATVASTLNDSSLARAAWPSDPASARSGGENEVIWSTSHGMDHLACKIGLAPANEASTKITINCGSAPEQDTTIAPVTAALTRQAAIEVIDATLKARPVDLASMGETAYMWPENHADLSPQRATPAQRAAMSGEMSSDGVPPGWYD